MPTAFASPTVVRTGSFSTAADGISWLAKALGDAGWTIAQTYASSPGAGVLLVGDTHQTLDSRVKVAIRDYSSGSGGFMYGWGPDQWPMISIQAMSYDEERQGPLFPFACSGLPQQIAACPGQFLTSRVKVSCLRQPYMPPGASIQVGVPRLQVSSGQCSAGSSTESWFAAADGAWLGPGGGVGGAGGFYLSNTPGVTFRETWKLPPEACYVYGFADLGPFWNAGGAYGNSAYGNCGWDPYFTPRILPWCNTNSGQYAAAHAPKDWTLPTQDSTPFLYPPLICYGNARYLPRGVAGAIMQGQLWNTAWLTIPNTYRAASRIVDLTDPVRYDPLDRIDPGIFGQGHPGQVYNDSYARYDVNQLNAMGSLYTLVAGGGGVNVY